MFREAYGRNKYTSTGVIQWMLDNARPSLIWHLYDYYLVPGGRVFGTKKDGNRSAFSGYDRSIAIRGERNLIEPIKGLTGFRQAINIDGKEAARMR